MANLRLTDKADFGVMYDAEIQMYDPEWFRSLNFTREMFIAHYANSPSVGFEIDGKMVGGMLLHEKKAHMAVLPEYHGRWALLWMPTLNWLFSLQDPVSVDVAINNDKCIRFLERSNFKRTGVKGIFVGFELSAKYVEHLRQPRSARTGNSG
ncbi:GNAT family N-acetyltransferase [Paraherbaspirillum soli]|uniref:GNAT family N-acetyltransferase n=1 Tax=Paraherbaspirillum soli TaxID=631222 RepID=A0ABW0MAG1_9BURK